MYQNPERTEYDAIVSRVRGHFGQSVDIGGYSHNDLLRLRKLDAQRAAEVAKSKAAQPLNDAMGQLNAAHRRAVAAWQQIEAGQKRIAANRREHQILGFDIALLEPMQMPKLVEVTERTIEAHDEATTEMAQMAAAIEIKARKINSAASGSTIRRTSRTAH
ncbi:hypothetical protein QA649_08965 [Bradyrhizobium sp. CB1717]|uniref:hypothetical protein n=1 Tax=Bradyrhizobium sp. CB1717 TaxID=3039154 RepID=UPI0024B166EB|nr:hypothetical protein [Bradyrhizobium sp. CB1717]WFU26321.1 hypothetical protein QA649_08965 [Bradyrhizobium sp. CB1717]